MAADALDFDEDDGLIELAGRGNMSEQGDLQWPNIRARMPGGFIAMIGAKSSAADKRALVEFSVRTKRTLGREGLLGETYPLLGMSSWEEVPEDERQLCVFAAVLNDTVVGYAVCQLHSRIMDGEGNVLAPQGEPIPPQPIRVWSLQEFLQADPDSFPKTLEGWCVESIVVESAFQRRGLGKLLLVTASESLDTPLEEMAYGAPIGDAGTALLLSLGLSPDKVRLCDA